MPTIRHLLRRIRLARLVVRRHVVRPATQGKLEFLPDLVAETLRTAGAMAGTVAGTMASTVTESAAALVRMPADVYAEVTGLFGTERPAPSAGEDADDADLGQRQADWSWG